MKIVAEIIEKVTEKAILVRVFLGTKNSSFWLPKSQIKSEYPLKSGVLNASIEVPNWLADNLIKEGKILAF